MSNLDSITIATGYLQLTANIVLINPSPFRAEGLTVNLVAPGAGAPITQSLLSGTADYTNVLAHPIQSAVEGQPLKFLATYLNKGWELWARPEIGTIQDLAGKKVAPTSPMAHKYFELALKRKGVSPDSVKTGAPVLFDNAVDEILSGEVDAAILLPPATVQAERAGLHCMLRMGDVGDPPTCGLVTTNKRLKERSDEVARAVRAMLASVKQLLEDRVLALSLVKKLGTSEQLAERAVNVMLAQLVPSGELSEKSQYLWIQFAKELAGIENDVPLSQVFDFSILREITQSKATYG